MLEGMLILSPSLSRMFLFPPLTPQPASHHICFLISSHILTSPLPPPLLLLWLVRGCVFRLKVTGSERGG